MRKGKSLIGMRIISQTQGAMLGQVKDLVFDHQTGDLVALLLADKDLFGLIDAQIVLWAEVRQVGAEAILVGDQLAARPASECPHVKELLQRTLVLSGIKIYTTDGHDLGTLADLYLDESSGKVVGYEVSHGRWSDYRHGKQFLPAPQHVTLGKDVVLVPPEAADDLMPIPVANGTSLVTPGNKPEDGVAGLLEHLRGLSLLRQQEWVSGRRAGRPVCALQHTSLTGSYPV